MNALKLVLHSIWIIVLSLLTQIGGLIWILSLLVSTKFKTKNRIVFPILYLTFNLIIIPPTAKLFRREQLPVFSDHLKPRNWVYPLLFRNYVDPKLHAVLIKSSNNLSKKNISLTYLDANFPFINGFPLLPHLSHNDGKKIDLSFMYLNANSLATDNKPSLSGYGVYAMSENNRSSKPCITRGYWQYDFPKYLTFGIINNLKLDKKNTAEIIKELLDNSEIEKIFIEPHLKHSLGFNHQNKIRYHGCQAVRHDDHIHLQIK